MQSGWRTTTSTTRQHFPRCLPGWSARLALAVMICASTAALKPAQAASEATTFGVGAIVVAPCVVGPQSPTHLGKAAATPSQWGCTATPGKPNSASGRPVTRLDRDNATGMQTLTVEF